jgi:hypothetical protein
MREPLVEIPLEEPPGSNEIHLNQAPIRERGPDKGAVAEELQK